MRRGLGLGNRRDDNLVDLIGNVSIGNTFCVRNVPAETQMVGGRDMKKGDSNY